MKFRRGLNARIEGKVATMENRPRVDDYEGWMIAAGKFEGDGVGSGRFREEMESRLDAEGFRCWGRDEEQ